jgi:hypothetical protein
VSMSGWIPPHQSTCRVRSTREDWLESPRCPQSTVLWVEPALEGTGSCWRESKPWNPGRTHPWGRLALAVGCREVEREASFLFFFFFFWWYWGLNSGPTPWTRPFCDGYFFF